MCDWGESVAEPFIDSTVGAGRIEALVEVIEEFARGTGSNLLTITWLRVRMGGWSEYFITLFPDHQQKHQRHGCYRRGKGSCDGVKWCAGAAWRARCAGWPRRRRPGPRASGRR